MEDNQEELKIAEKYLAEMLKADQNRDYASFIKRYETVDSGFSEDVFIKDVEAMKDELGTYKERVYLGSLNCSGKGSPQRSLRFVWRGIYEKNEALIVLGIHQNAGVWYVNENHVS
ncbi:hypothetical protein [Halomonas sp. MS1]|nr:hypothetical protein [Halomonas sp. MS1]UTD54415.1 hypothetical protein NF683_14770 [Halomonas sp. MS1]